LHANDTIVILCNWLNGFFNYREKRAVQAIMGILNSPVKAWHCAAAELLGRLIINPDNEPFLIPFFPQVKLLFMHVLPC
jgi:hypothetical protein